MLIVLALAASMCALAAPAQMGRDRLLMDFGWKFRFGKPLDVDGGAFVKAAGSAEYGVRAVDSDWRTVDLPHDWVVKLPFVPNGDLSHGCRPVGKAFPENSIGWYARRFDVPKDDLGRRLSMESDGVFRNSQVWLNGYYLGRSESGYSPFEFDITDYLNYGGSNRLVVRVEHDTVRGLVLRGRGDLPSRLARQNLAGPRATMGDVRYERGQGQFGQSYRARESRQ